VIHPGQRLPLTFSGRFDATALDLHPALNVDLQVSFRVRPPRWEAGMSLATTVLYSPTGLFQRFRDADGLADHCGFCDSGKEQVPVYAQVGETKLHQVILTARRLFTGR
jgi:hypothetical protein